MAINEQIQTGRKFRKMIDETNRLWLRISFWTKACDVEFDDGQTAETKFANVMKTINDLSASFRNSVNKIYNKLKELGFTPSANNPDGICGAIQSIHDTRYTNGYNSGYNIGYNEGKSGAEGTLYFDLNAHLSGGSPEYGGNIGNTRDSKITISIKIKNGAIQEISSSSETGQTSAQTMTWLSEGINDDFHAVAIVNEIHFVQN